jgi:hypothetical protein
VRISILLILLGAVALGRPCLAVEASMGKHSVEELKGVCEKAGGSFSQDAGGYGCGTNCKGGPGTDCTVACKTDQPCYAQTMGRKRPASMLNALQPGRAGR